MRFYSLMILTGGLFMTIGCSAIPSSVAHRGASAIAPENTIAAIRKAWERKADATEIDVYLTADNKIILSHDGNTARTSGVKHVIAETHSDILRTLDVGSWKSEEYKGEKMPFLSEALQEIPAGKKIFVEIKCGPEIAPQLKKDIDESGVSDRVILISFNLEALSASKKIMPEIPAYWLKSTPKNEAGVFPSHDPALLDQATKAGIDGMDIHFGGVTETFMKEVRKRNQKLFVWTVNDTAEARRLAALKVDGITTDVPMEVREAIESAHPWRSFFSKMYFWK